MILVLKDNSIAINALIENRKYADTCTSSTWHWSKGITLSLINRTDIWD